MYCQCRNCRLPYTEAKSRADYKGYCSQRCLHEKAKALGYRKGMSEYQILKAAGEIGSVPTTPPGYVGPIDDWGRPVKQGLKHPKTDTPSSQKLKAVHEVHLRVTQECDDEPLTAQGIRDWVLAAFEGCDYGRVEVIDPPADEDPLRHYSEGEQAKALDKLAGDVEKAPEPNLDGATYIAAEVFGRPDED